MNVKLKPREKVGNHSITLENSYWQFAKELGNGNASAGIRKALYEAYANKESSTQEPPCGGA